MLPVLCTNQQKNIKSVLSLSVLKIHTTDAHAAG